MAKLGEDILEWDTERLASWLNEEGMSDCIKTFTAKNLNGRKLVTLSEADIKTLHVSHESKRKLIKTIEKYKAKRKNITQRMFKDKNDGNSVQLFRPTRKPSSFSREDEEDDAYEDNGWDSDEFDSDPADNESSSDEAGEYVEPEADESTPSHKKVPHIQTGLVAQLRAGIAHSIGRGNENYNRAVKPTYAADEDENEDEDAIYDLPPDEEELYEEPSDSSGGAVVVRPPSNTKIIKASESESPGEYIEARPRKASEDDVQENYEVVVEGKDISFTGHGSRPFMPTKLEQQKPRSRLVKQPSEDMYEIPQPEEQYEIPDGQQTAVAPPPRPPKGCGSKGQSPMQNTRPPPEGSPLQGKPSAGSRPPLPSKPGGSPGPARKHPTHIGQSHVPGPRPPPANKLPASGTSPSKTPLPVPSNRPGPGPGPGPQPLPANRYPLGTSPSATPPSGPTSVKRVPQPTPNKGPPPEPSPVSRPPARAPEPLGTPPGPPKPPRLSSGDAPDSSQLSPTGGRQAEFPRPASRAPEPAASDAPPPRPPKQGHPPQGKGTSPKQPQPIPQTQRPPQTKKTTPSQQNQQPKKITPSQQNQPQAPQRKQAPPANLPQSKPQMPLPAESTPPKPVQAHPPKQGPTPPGRRGPLPTPAHGHTPPPSQVPPSLPRTDNSPKQPLPPRKSSDKQIPPSQPRTDHTPKHPLPPRKTSVPLPAPPPSANTPPREHSGSSIESGSADEPVIPLQHLQAHSGKRSLPPPPGSAPPPPSQKTPVDIMKEAPWFQGAVDRQKTETSLKALKKDGAFLVRNSTKNPNDYSMSLYYKGGVRHLRIPKKDGKYVLGDSGTQRFDSILDLVNHYRQNNVDLKAGGATKLTIPCQVYS